MRSAGHLRGAGHVAFGEIERAQQAACAVIPVFGVAVNGAASELERVLDAAVDECEPDAAALVSGTDGAPREVIIAGFDTGTFGAPVCRDRGGAENGTDREADHIGFACEEQGRLVRQHPGKPLLVIANKVPWGARKRGLRDSRERRQ